MEQIKSITLTVKDNKFVAYQASVTQIKNCWPIIDQIKNEHAKADHLIYAYVVEGQAGYEEDKEPRGSSGIQLYRLLQLKKKENTLIIVVRYCGCKLGVGGLARAYTKAASLLL